MHPDSLSSDRSDEERGTEMDTTAHRDGKLHIDMEASARALAAADNAHVHEAMDSVKWERRGFLQRLTRRDR
jgi:hypothetical protein